MNRDMLFKHFERLNEHEKIQLLKASYDNMNTQQKRNVFYQLEKVYINNNLIDADALLNEILKFREDSLQGVYFAPFMINSKNYMEVPEETDMWFEKLAELLLESTKLSQQGHHTEAVQCFNILFECVESMESGEDIIFADEYGMWMLPIHEEPYIEAYIQSAAAILNPSDYLEAVLPLIKRDGYTSFCNKVYEKAKLTANKKQQSLLMEINSKLRKNQ